MRRSPRPRLQALVCIDDAGCPPGVVASLSPALLKHYGGQRLDSGVWRFSSASSGILACLDLTQLARTGLRAFVITCETADSTSGDSPIIARAARVSRELPGDGVYACGATVHIASLEPGGDVWFADAGAVSVAPGDLQRVYRVGMGPQVSAPSLIIERNHLPKQARSFVGRRRELDEICDLLNERFLVTLTGIPGVGKSVLAVEVARALEDSFRSGILWVDASMCESLPDLVDAIRLSGGLPRLVGGGSPSALASELSDWETLVVLDNCERIPSFARTVVDEILKPTTTLGVLVTSTAALGARKEHVYVLEGLSLPSPQDEVSIATALRSDAVSLFAERATAAKSDFVVSLNNLADVTELCRRLGGHPLAIETVAAKMASRSLAACLNSLDKHLRWPAPGVRLKHSTVSNALTHAFGMLDAEDQDLWLKLSLNNRAVTLGEMQAPWLGTEEAVAAGIDRLVNHSFIAFDLSNGRYSVPPVLAMFAREVLEKREAAPKWRAEFCRHVFARVRVAADLFKQSRDADALSLLDECVHEVMAAARFALMQADMHQELAALLPSLYQYWLRRNLMPEAEDLLSEAMERLDLDPPEAARYCNFIGAARVSRQDFAQAEPYFERALSLLASDRSNPSRAAALGNLGLIAAERGDFDLGRGYFDEAVAVARQASDERRLAIILLNAADCLIRWAQLGTPVDARLLLGDAQSRLDEAELRMMPSQDPFVLQGICHARGELEMLRGNARDAEREFTRAALLCSEAGCPQEAAQGVERLAELELQLGNPERAGKLLGAAIALRVQHGKLRRPREQRLFDQTMGAIRSRLGAKLCQECVAFGSSVTIEDLFGTGELFA